MLYPMFAMVILTSLVACWMLLLRTKAVKSGNVRLSQFRLNTGDLPDSAVQAGRNYINLFELPVLFYAAGATSLALEIQTSAMIVTAWIFVVTRIIHSWIHLTNNNVVTRLGAFVSGVICVLVMWGILVASYATR